MELHWWLATLVVHTVCLSKMLAFGFVNQEERKCKYAKSSNMLSIQCYDMNLREVPQNLKSSVEVLNLSYNRIRKLAHNTFQRYTDIKFLILYENMIFSVESGAFAPLTSLQEVDLSNNALMTIPMELFQLPKLRNLYVDSNELRFLEDDLRALEKPIRAPLEYLNVADCRLNDIPDLGILPKLWQLNASSNPLKNFNIDQLANMCNLKTLDLMKTQISQCSCQQVNNHLMMLGADTKFVPICLKTLDRHTCPLPYNLTVNSTTFSDCRSSIELAATRSFWQFAAGCFGGFVLVLLVTWYCLLRCRKRRAKRRLRRAAQSRKHSVISPRNAASYRPDDEPLHCDTA